MLANFVECSLKNCLGFKFNEYHETSVVVCTRSIDLGVSLGEAGGRGVVFRSQQHHNRTISYIVFHIALS